MYGPISDENEAKAKEMAKHIFFFIISLLLGERRILLKNQRMEKEIGWKAWTC